MEKFVILTTQRTGPTYIRLWLNNHSMVRCHGEVFLRKYGARDGFKYFVSQKMGRQITHAWLCNKIMSRIPANWISGSLLKTYLNSLFHDHTHSAPFKEFGTGHIHHSQVCPSDDQAVGFKLMIGQLRDYRYLHSWIKDNNLRIIVLKRENLLKMYLSRLMMKKRGLAHSSVSEESQKVSVDSRHMLKNLNDNIRMTEQIKQAFPSNPILEISYEGFFNEHSKTSKIIQEFLCVKPMDVPAPSLKKINPDLVKDIISNYDEVAKVLKETSFEQYLK